MKHIFVDTSFFYALADRGDVHHAKAKAFVSRNTAPLVTSNYCFDELVTIIRYDFGIDASEKVGTSVLNSQVCTLVRVSREDEESAWQIFRRYRDQDFSFTLKAEKQKAEKQGRSPYSPFARSTGR